MVSQTLCAGSAPAAAWSLGVALLSHHPEHAFFLEILDHSGLAYRPIQQGEGPEVIEGCRVWLVVCYLPDGLPVEWPEALRTHLSHGGGAVLLGNPAGLEDLFGVKSLGRDIGEGYLLRDGVPGDAGSLPLHHFGGQAVRSLVPDQTMSAKLIGTDGAAVDTVCGVRPSGALSAIFVDIIKAARHIQHGIPVAVDGVPAPDGSAPLNDNILKAEDGMVLDWRMDRRGVAGVSFPFFTEPVADIWKEMLLSEVFRVAASAGAPLRMLWYWPDQVPAIGQISYDSDHNDPDLAHKTIQVLKSLDIRTTWLIIAPGYEVGSGVVEGLNEGGHEVGFHFDAGTHPEARWECWTREEFHRQLHKVARVCGVKGFRTNKNHYTRWQGALDVLKWCSEAGIRADLTKLPSKLGSAGFFAGTCHPWFHHNIPAEPVECLEIHGFTQDPVVTVPPEVQLHLLRQCVQHHGVAAFTYHPAHIARPGVEEALGATIGLGRELGVQWWTAEEIHDWEAARRSVKWTADGQISDTSLIAGRNPTVLTLDPQGGFSYLGAFFKTR